MNIVHKGTAKYLAVIILLGSLSGCGGFSSRTQSGVLIPRAPCWSNLGDPTSLNSKNTSACRLESNQFGAIPFGITPANYAPWEPMYLVFLDDGFSCFTTGEGTIAAIGHWWSDAPSESILCEYFGLSYLDQNFFEAKERSNLLYTGRYVLMSLQRDAVAGVLRLKKCTLRGPKNLLTPHYRDGLGALLQFKLLGEGDPPLHLFKKEDFAHAWRTMIPK
jgi:hypothetical protein